jgi:hypothetical protein
MFKQWLESFAPDGDIENWVTPDQKNAHLMGINTNDAAAKWLRKRDAELGVNANPKTRSDAYARVKPQKPYPSFPLTANGNGKWSKKIGGKVFYFGPWEDPEGALEKYLDVKDDIHAGREARRTPSLWNQGWDGRRKQPQPQPPENDLTPPPEPEPEPRSDPFSWDEFLPPVSKSTMAQPQATPRMSYRWSDYMQRKNAS